MYERALNDGTNGNKYFVAYKDENSTNSLRCSCLSPVRLWTTSSSLLFLLLLYCYGNCTSLYIVRSAGFHE